MHSRREEQSLEMHRRIAGMLLANPRQVLGKAMANLELWRERREGASAQSSALEWQNLLTHASPEEISSFLVSGDEKSMRMRQSSPFAGVLSPREVWAIKRGHETT